MTEEQMELLENLSEDELLDEKYSDLLCEAGKLIEEKYKDEPDIEPSPEVMAKFNIMLDVYFADPQ